jgi:hypothetical protein
MERIDFSSSSIFWNGPSNGIFKLASVLKIDKLNSSKVETIFGLGESVLAGNMYVSDGLLKKPPYLFQVAGSTGEQYIFRNFLPNQKRSTFPRWFKKNTHLGDTHQKNHFDEFCLNLKKIPAKAVKNYEEIEEVFYDNNFTARAQIEYYGLSCSVEFPVNHINVKPEIKMWQVETGPVLFPIFEVDVLSDLELLPCFTHFNNFEKLDIFYDYPFSSRSDQLKNKGIMQDINCKIELFSSLN